jgi:hypothetical protein
VPCNGIGIGIGIGYDMVWYWYWYCIGMHIIANAYHFHAMVCNGIGIGMQWYGMVLVWYGIGIGIGMVWYGIDIGMVWYGMVYYGMVWYGIVMQDHLSTPAMRQPASPHQCTHSMRKRGTTLSYSNFEFESTTINVCKAVRAKRPCLYAGFSCR